MDCRVPRSLAQRGVAAVMTVEITGGSILTPFGDLERTWEQLLAGESAVSPRSFPGVGLSLPAAAIEGLPGRWGSWQRLEALLEQLLATIPALSYGTALICATTKGAVDELRPSSASQSGQPWQLGGYLRQRLAVEQPATVVSAACASGLIAIIQGAMMIRAGRCRQVLVIAVDQLAEFIAAGFHGLRALSPTAARPFDRRRDGLTLGEAAGWVLLSEAGAVPVAGTAVLESWAIRCDAAHITAPCRQASGLISALEAILEQQAAPIGGINTHGTGTVYNDAMELLAYSQILNPGLPLCSVKGALGHSLAATGLVEALLSVESLKHGLLPPTAGLQQPESSDLTISGTRPVPLSCPSVLTCNSGFGGINAALLLRLRGRQYQTL